MVLHGRQRREGKVKAEMSRLWPPSLNTHCLTGVCDLCVAFVLECKVSQDSAVEENEEQLEIPWNATFACISSSMEKALQSKGLSRGLSNITVQKYQFFSPQLCL